MTFVGLVGAIGGANPALWRERDAFETEMRDAPRLIVQGL
jgi:hypothetical protein